MLFNVSYEPAFANLLTKRGVPLSAQAVPSKKAVDADPKGLANWLKSLETSRVGKDALA